MNYEWSSESVLSCLRDASPREDAHSVQETTGNESIETARILVGQESEIIFNSNIKHTSDTR